MGTQLPPKKRGGTALPQFSARVCCGQTAGWINMPLGTEVGLGQGYIVLHRDQAPPPKRGTSPNFLPMSIVAKRLNGLGCHLIGTEIGLSPSHIVLDGDPAPPRQAWCCLQVKLCDPCLSALYVPWCEKALYKYSSFPFLSFTPPPEKEHSPSQNFGPCLLPPIFGPCLLWPNGRPSQLLLTTCFS